MTQFFLILSSFLISSNSFSYQLPTKSQDIDFVKFEADLKFKNIPSIEKQFRSAKNKQEREDIKKECQDWVFQEMSLISAPFFKVWCSYETDVVLRQYNMRGHLLIKNW